MNLYRDITTTKILGKTEPIWTQSTAISTATSVDCNPNTNVWIAVNLDGSAWKSTDDGQNWTALTTGLGLPPGQRNFRSVRCNYETGSWVVVDFRGYAVRSTNDGTSWTVLTAPPGTATPGNNIFATAGQLACNFSENTWLATFGKDASLGYISRSTDDGATWSKVYTPGVAPSSFWNINVNQRTKKWVVQLSADSLGGPAGEVLYSTSNGSAWTPYATLVGGGSWPVKVNSRFGIWRITAATGFPITSGNTNYYISTDDAATWSSTSSPTSVVLNNDNALTWVSPGNPLQVSFDNTANWQTAYTSPLTIGTAQDMNYNRSTGTWIIVGTGASGAGIARGKSLP